ncbi:MobF family relaxase [Antrihabitans stalactiti]|nr:MobF family relaxase [Antrihabitans stalactiti]
MTMSMHKLTAGDGYTYLTKQVAAADSTELGTSSLADYYSIQGESPGQWMGAGLAAFESIATGDPVTESQMKALFGEGRHPNAERLETQRIGELVERNMADGMTERSAAKKAAKEALASTRLGTPFRVYTNANAFRQEVAARFTAHNLRHGNRWDAPVPDDERARIRTDVGLELFVQHHGRDPLHDSELSGFVARHSRHSTTAVAGYDLTCSPVKSVSALWAIAPTPVADTIRQAHDDAVADMLTFLETHAAYTRLGRNGIQQVDVQGLIGTAYTHRDSRAGDPDLHTHLVISNKVRTLDGKWLALDGTPIHKWAVAASEVYNTRLESHLRTRLGLRFTERPNTDPRKRAVREVVGVDEKLCKFWSSRREAIEVRRGELATAFQRDHGREPTPVEAIALAQQATLDTRDRKHEPRSEAEQRIAWRAEAVRVLGGDTALAAMIRTTLHPRQAARRTHVGRDWIDQTADRIVATVARGRATWQEAHVRAEAERVTRAADVDPHTLVATVERLTAATLHATRSVPLGTPDRVNEPEVLRRTDGTSVYTSARTQLYTCEPIVAAEQRLVATAGARDGRRVSTMTVELELLAHAANNPGRALNPGQSALVREFATSGARLQLALAPAGTGKTTAMKVLARCWEADGGTVIGLAPTGNAAAVLREDMGTVCDTIDKLVDTLDRVERARMTGQTVQVPSWIRDIDDRTLVVIDEAALAGTLTLDRAVGFLISRGASVRLVGDDRQLSAVAAGGVVRDIADTHGAVTLSHVLRFTDTAEGSASLALRDGDPAAIGYYLDHGRIHVGDHATAEDLAYTAWSRDRQAGLDAVMMAPTRDTVHALNERARADRLANVSPADIGPDVALADGLSASAGDTIRTTRNDRRLPLSATDWVRNGYRFTVQRVLPDGSLDATHLRTGRTIHLPADYVASDVALGYAATIHTCQGITADTSHTVLTGHETRNDVYVPVTRGRHSNHLYFATALPGDEHSVLTDEALHPVTAVDLFTRVLNRDGRQRSATTTTRELADPRQRLAHAVDTYSDALGTAAKTVLGADALARIDAAADTLHPGLTDQPAWPTLRHHLATLAIGGQDPVAALTSAARSRDLGNAGDVAAVLDWRIDATGRHSAGTGPLPWLRGIPTALSEHPTWGRYLRTRSGLVAGLAADVAADTRAWEPATAPLWARPLAGGADDGLLADLAVWRAALGVDDSDRRPTGPDQRTAAEHRHQTGLAARAHVVLGDPTRSATVWTALANRIDPRIVEDPYWPVLADRLTAAARAGIDVEALVLREGHTSPLPTELPAAALWWRLSHHLTPAVLDAGIATSRLHPHWEPVLHAVLGEEADRVTRDAAWPALVAAIDSADPNRWLPEQLLAASYDLLRGAHDDQHPLRPDELATALTWRIEALLHAPNPPADQPLPDEPVDEQSVPPEFSEQRPRSTTMVDGVSDADYLASLLDLAPPDDPDIVEPDPDPDRVLPAPDPVDTDDWIRPDDAWTALPYADLPVAEQISRLEAERDAAQRHVAELWSTQIHPTAEGTHVSAALPLIRDLRERADQQRPHQLAANLAHERWLEADLKATAAENELATLQRQTRTARDRDVALSAELDAGLKAIEAQHYRAHADTARGEADSAQQELVDIAGPGGIVTEEQIHAVQALAESLDTDELNAARRNRDILDGHLLRAQSRGARDLADSLNHTGTAAQHAAKATPQPPAAVVSDDSLSAPLPTRRPTRRPRPDPDHHRRGPTL